MLPKHLRRAGAPIGARGGPRALRGPSAPLCAVIPFALIAAIAAGCASTDPSREIRDAADLVGSRGALAPVWTAPVDATPLPEPLDLATATRRALERHPTLRAEVAAVAAARADFAQADRLPNPRLRLAFGFPIDGGGGDPIFAGLMAPLAALWTRPARLAAADAELRSAVLALADRALLAVESARRAFAAVHHGRERARLDTRAVELAAERLALAEALARAGEMGRAEVEETRVEFARVRDRALRSAEEAAIAERELLELLGEAGRADCPPLDPAGLALSPAVPSERSLIPLAAAQRLDVAAARAAADAAEESLGLARRERFGDSELGVEYERDMDDREFLYPALALELPILDPGGAMVAAAAARAEGARREAEAVESRALLEVRTAHARHASARDRLAAIETDWLAAARSRAALAAETAAAGEMPRAEALAAALEEIEAERERNDAELDTRAARFALERAAGGTLVALNPDTATRTGSGLPRGDVVGPSETKQSSGRESSGRGQAPADRRLTHSPVGRWGGMGQAPADRRQTNSPVGGWGGMGQAPAEYGRSQSRFGEAGTP